MSILDKASLIQIPSGYKSTKLYSIEPTNGDGDFTFARSSSGTRVNSEGLIEVASVLGSELVVNGDFATDSDWSSTEVATIGISGGSINFSSTSSNKRIQNIGSIIVGKKYIVNYDIVSISEGSFAFQDGVSTYTYRSSIGSYSEEITASGTFIRIRTAGTTTGSIDNVSVKEVITNNVPRLDYSGGASCASLLLEPQRTNLALYSEQFENAAWSNEGLSLSANDTTSPDGATNADKIIETADNGVHVIYNTSPITASATSTASVFYKKGTRRYFSVKIQIGSNSYTQVFDSEGLTTGGNSSNGLTNVSTKIEDYGNGWVRASVAGTSASGTSTYVIIGLSNSLNPTFHPTNYNPTYEGSGTDYGYAYGAQVEAGSYPTSYIPTTSATVTRTADVCNNAGTSATFNSTEGVLFAEIAALANDSTQRAISLSDGSNTNRVCLLYNDSSNSIRLFVQVGGSTQSSIISTSYTITDSNKIAVKWKENDFALWINGVEVGTDNSGVSFTSNTLNTLDFRFPNDTTFFYGKTKQLMVFNEALSDEELSDLTGQANLSFNNLATFYNYTIL